MRLGIDENGVFADYFWTTPKGLEISTSQVNAIRQIAQEITGKALSFEAVLKLADQFKTMED